MNVPYHTHVDKMRIRLCIWARQLGASFPDFWIWCIMFFINLIAPNNDTINCQNILIIGRKEHCSISYPFLLNILVGTLTIMSKIDLSSKEDIRNNWLTKFKPAVGRSQTRKVCSEVLPEVLSKWRTDKIHDGILINWVPAYKSI